MQGSGESAGRLLVGRSPQIARVRALIDRVARSRSHVLVLGESGTGKEVVARAIHAANPKGEFVTIDCGTLTGTLVESELFGYAKGSFTGAAETRKGLVEAADGGTAFFDEIGDLRPELQVKLLRLVQDSEFRAVGSVKTRKVDVRVVAATHRDLPAMVERGDFRADLYFRLKVITVRIAPLRERKEDIPPLIEHFLERRGARHRISPQAMDALMAYHWPGNVRELQNALEQMTTLNSGPVLHERDLPSTVQDFLHAARPMLFEPGPELERDLPVIHRASPAPVPLLRATEEQTIRDAMAQAGGRRGLAAQLLGIGRTTLYRKLKEYGLDGGRAGQLDLFEPRERH
jgi:DNA-binding NtrC family response regulator